jgi:hypothetical protein
MVNATLGPDAGLPAVLAARARAASDGRLALDVIGGLSAGVGIAAWRPAVWLVLLPIAACFVAFGAWGIAERELAERERSPGRLLAFALRTVKALSILVGGGAAAVAGFELLHLALGTWIS